MVGHEDLGALIHDDMGRGDAAVSQALQLGEELRHVQGHAVADDVDGVGVEHAGGELVQGKLPIVADDGVTRVRAALEADDHVGLLGQEIGDLALALVAPVGAYDCFYHRVSSCPQGFARGRRPPLPFPADADII